MWGDGTYSFAGDGAAAFAAQVRGPSGVEVDAAGNLLIADRDNHRIRKVTAATGVITTVAGGGANSGGYGGEAGAATSSALSSPEDVAVDAAGNLFIADSYNKRIRKVTAATGAGTTKSLTLYDDGDLIKGDDIANDGIFHNKLAINPPDTMDRFYVASDPASGQRSTVSRLPVTARLTTIALTTTLDFNKSVDTLVKTGLAAGKSWSQVCTEVQALLAATPAEVKASGLSDDGDGVWWVTKDELLIVLQSSTYGASSATVKRGGRQQQPRVDSIPEELRQQPILLPDLYRGRAAGRFGTLADPTITTDSNRALGYRLTRRSSSRSTKPTRSRAC